MTFAVQNGGYPPGFLIGGPIVNGIPVGGGDSSSFFSGSQFPSTGFASSQASLGGGFSQSNPFPTPGIIGAQPQTFSSGTFVPSGLSSGSFQSTLPSSGNLASMFGAPVGTEAALLKMQNAAQFEQNLSMQQMIPQQLQMQQMMQQQALAQQAAMQQSMMQQTMMQGQGQYFPQQYQSQQQILPQQQQDAGGGQMMMMFMQMLMMLLLGKASQQKAA